LFDKSQFNLIQVPPGRAGDYVIPDSVVSIGEYSFKGCADLTSVGVPNSVISIEANAFQYCTGLSSIIIPNSTISIKSSVFWGCRKLTTVLIGESVTDVGGFGFRDCTLLTNVFFAGDRPRSGGLLFSGSDNVTVYYLPGTTGWGDSYADRPAVLWNPVISDPTPGVAGTGFSFRITGTEDIPIGMEATDDLVAGIWTRLGTNTLAGGTLEFQDEDAWEDGSRVYRIAAP
jgi:hypothetical protein